MIRTKHIFIIFVFLYSYSNGQTSELKSFGSNPGNLRAYIHTPNLYVDSIKRPLVIVLHGCTQNASEIEEQSGWSVLADSNIFYVLYPEQKRLNNMNNCFNWFFKDDCTKDNGEVFSIYQMMQKVCDSLPIDTSRIFIYGLSAGAMMGVSLGACYPDEFNMVASFAGGPYTGGLKPGKGLSSMIKADKQTSQQRALTVKKQNPEYTGKYPTLLIFHGEKDKVVNYGNANELIKQWSGLYDVVPKPSTTYETYDGISDLNRYDYFKGGEEEPFAIFYSMKNAGHSLPVNPGTGMKEGGKTGMFAHDADFFSTWYVANDFGILK